MIRLSMYRLRFRGGCVDHVRLFDVRAVAAIPSRCDVAIFHRKPRIAIRRAKATTCSCKRPNQGPRSHVINQSLLVSL